MQTLLDMLNTLLPILIAIGIGVIVYMVAMILLKGFSENDWNTIPGGNKILYFLKRIGIY